MPISSIQASSTVASSVVADGPPARVLTPALLAEVYHVDAEVARHPSTGVPQIRVVPGLRATP
ncbi:hypothetical protein ACGFJC_10490 [Nonomuraea fuscirosea]|uniref:hypothetical protein n=1 Tax=Nonomuraea fuscirosea TaxID=1291556 RepID=UPI00347A9C06